MSEASHAHAHFNGHPAEAGEAQSDTVTQAAGLAGGAVTGAAVAIFIEGMPVKPTDTQAHSIHRGVNVDGGAPPMVHASHLQEATIAGFTGLGLAAAVAYTSLRARAHR